jgi:hypothetical protein
MHFFTFLATFVSLFTFVVADNYANFFDGTSTPSYPMPQGTRHIYQDVCPPPHLSSHPALQEIWLMTR